MGALDYIVLEANAAVSAYCIYFVYKDYTRSIFFALIEHLANAACANTNKHFNKIRPGDAKNGISASPAIARASKEHFEAKIIQLDYILEIRRSFQLSVICLTISRFHTNAIETIFAKLDAEKEILIDVQPRYVFIKSEQKFE
ncbi:hypothetical protein DINM_007155 [Dirofilaria immitis]|nr:hypothetical protein [Dirofilaria immitis]